MNLSYVSQGLSQEQGKRKARGRQEEEPRNDVKLLNWNLEGILEDDLVASSWSQEHLPIYVYGGKFCPFILQSRELVVSMYSAAMWNAVGCDFPNVLRRGGVNTRIEHLGVVASCQRENQKSCHKSVEARYYIDTSTPNVW